VVACAQAGVSQSLGIAETPFVQGQDALRVEGDQYRILPDTHVLVRRVKEVFRRVLLVSGRRPGTALEVFVLDTPRVRAQALPNGYVVISRGVVELTGPDDSALAFLLAHEVAHQLRDHLALLAVEERLPLQSPPGAQAPNFPARRVATAHAMELEADRLGVLFATLAGYQPSAAIPILERVVAQVGSSPLHPDPRQRASGIRDMMQAIRANLEIFDVGLLYVVTGQYEAGARALESFASLFPAREVYSNLGLAYHKRALLYQVDDGLVHSLTLDPLTRAAAITRGPLEPRGVGPRGRAHPVFRENMEKAIGLYRLAVEADPDYALGHINLGAAYVDMGEYDYAIGELKRALRIDPSLKTAYLNRGVAYLKNGEPHLAEKDFLQAIAIDASDPAAHANLRVLYHRIGRADAAQRVSEVASRLEATRFGTRPPPAEGQIEMLGPVRVGMAASRLSQSLPAPPARVLKIPMGPRGERTVLLYERQALILVVHQGVVEAGMAREGYVGRTDRGVGIGGSRQDVESRYGRPRTVEGTPGVSLWVYPERGLVVMLRGERVAGWWIYEGHTGTAAR
jgi:tetratricopeptide (TPR) repeat protein